MRKIIFPQESMESVPIEVYAYEILPHLSTGELVGFSKVNLDNQRILKLVMEQWRDNNNADLGVQMKFKRKYLELYAHFHDVRVDDGTKMIETMISGRHLKTLGVFMRVFPGRDLFHVIDNIDGDKKHMLKSIVTACNLGYLKADELPRGFIIMYLWEKLLKEARRLIELGYGNEFSYGDAFLRQQDLTANNIHFITKYMEISDEAKQNLYKQILENCRDRKAFRIFANYAGRDYILETEFEDGEDSQYRNPFEIAGHEKNVAMLKELIKLYEE
jgi:hypothetical protein